MFAAHLPKGVERRPCFEQLASHSACAHAASLAAHLDGIAKREVTHMKHKGGCQLAVKTLASGLPPLVISAKVNCYYPCTVTGLIQLREYSMVAFCTSWIILYLLKRDTFWT